MRAAVIQSHGPPDVLEIMDLQTPVANEHQVRVKVKCAGIQPFDCAVRSSGWVPAGLKHYREVETGHGRVKGVVVID